MNNKGQTLVEFVLILPVFLFLIFVIYDIGKIYMLKSKLENDSSDIINLFKNGKDINEISILYNNDKININKSDNYYEIIVYNDVDILTPGLDKILGNPYTVNVTRYIPNEN